MIEGVLAPNPVIARSAVETPHVQHRAASGIEVLRLRGYFAFAKQPLRSG